MHETKMKLPIYSKVTNEDSFEARYTWIIKKGWYDDGKNQYIVEFEPVPKISTFRWHYYRFPLYGEKSTGRYFWLILSPAQNLRFSIMQHGVLKTLVMPFINLYRLIKSVSV